MVVTVRLVKLSTRRYSRKLAQAGLLAVYIEMQESEQGSSLPIKA